MRDLEATSAQYTEKLGLRLDRVEDYGDGLLRIGFLMCGDVFLELIQPLTDEVGRWRGHRTWLVDGSPGDIAHYGKYPPAKYPRLARVLACDYTAAADVAGMRIYRRLATPRCSATAFAN